MAYLSESQKLEFEEKGYLVLEGFLPLEVIIFRTIIFYVSCPTHCTLSLRV